MFAMMKSLNVRNRFFFQLVLSISLLVGLAMTAQAGTVFQVTTTADNGDNVNPTPGSLRAAILSANSTPGVDSISFSIGSGLQTIQPLSTLPTISEGVIIDGTTQPGFAGVPLIEIDGSKTTNSVGLIVNSNEPTTIRGLIMNRFAFSAIQLSGVGNNVVAGNYLGTNAAGNANFPNPNNGVGITVLSPGNTVGGLTAADRNIISGNRSQNVQMGIDVFGANAIGNKIIGNYIGVDVTGNTALGQVNAGIRLANASGTIVGGPTAAERNVISGNFENMDIGGGHDNKVQGNFIGTRADGTGGLTAGYGVWIETDSKNNIIGGINAGEGNVIPAAVNRGITVLDTSSGNAILGNSIQSPIPIDLKFDGVTPNDYGATLNDPSDADTGPNNLQNFPVINTVTPNGSNTIINGILRTEASKTYRIELFSNTSCNASGFGGGRFFLAANNISTDPSGNANFTFTIPTASITGTIFTATATDPGNSTSEFSQCTAAGPSANGAFQFGAATITFMENNGPANVTVTRTNGSAGAVSVNFATSGGTAIPGSDYTSKSGKLDFADGETIKTISIDLKDDQVAEPTKDFNVTLSNSIGGAVLGAQKVIDVIIGDDDAPTISINDVQVLEGNSGTTNATFTISLNRPYFKTVTVDYMTDTIGTATSGTDYQPTSGTVTFAIGETSKPATVLINGDTTPEPNEGFTVKLSNNTGVGISVFTGLGTILDDDTPATTIQFNQSGYLVQEDQTSVLLTVTRSGDISGASTIDYTTSDKTAKQNTDYTIAAGSLTFAAGESAKTISVLVNEDSYVEGNEQFDVVLSKPTGGAALGDPSTSTITIVDDQQESAANTIDSAQIFVSQQYHDFLNREPDSGGLAFWTNEITSCGANQSCIDTKRTNVSAAFYLSIEFQKTGYLRYLIEKESFGSLPKYAAFMRDLQEISAGVVVSSQGWEQKLSDNQNKFAGEWVNRAEFKAAYDPLSNAAYVNALYTNAGIVPPQAKRDSLVSALDAATENRAAVLLEVASDATFMQQQQNAAFVLMQYFGYLRRDPNAAPDSDFNGYNFWLNKLNQFNGDYNAAEMVKAFIVSGEYRQRFGQ
jgi:CSLREA domain-containing protein